MISHVTDHAEKGVARLIERYRKPLVSALLASWLGEVQEAEDALWQLLERTVTDAEGNALDVLGRIVGQPREGRVDDVYRVWVAARILVSQSSGKPEQLISIAKKLAGGAVIRLEEYYPASFLVRIQTAIDETTGNQIATLLQRAKGGGIAMHTTWSAEANGLAFRFAPGSTVVSGSQRGFEAGAFAAVSDGSAEVEFAEPVPGDALFDDLTFDPLTDDDDGEFLTIG